MSHKPYSRHDPEETQGALQPPQETTTESERAATRGCGDCFHTGAQPTARVSPVLNLHESLRSPAPPEEAWQEPAGPPADPGRLSGSPAQASRGEGVGRPLGRSRSLRRPARSSLSARASRVAGGAASSRARPAGLRAAGSSSDTAPGRGLCPPRTSFTPTPEGTLPYPPPRVRRLSSSSAPGQRAASLNPPPPAHFCSLQTAF